MIKAKFVFADNSPNFYSIISNMNNKIKNCCTLQNVFHLTRWLNFSVLTVPNSLLIFLMILGTTCCQVPEGTFGT